MLSIPIPSKTPLQRIHEGFESWVTICPECHEKDGTISAMESETEKNPRVYRFPGDYLPLLEVGYRFQPLTWSCKCCGSKFLEKTTVKKVQDGKDKPPQSA